MISDATYKLVFEGFPVMTVGTVDKNKSFHPFGLAVCSDEQQDDFRFLFNSIKV